MNAKLRVVATVYVVLLGVTMCLSQATEDKQQEFDAHVQKAQGYLRANRPDLAIPELQAAVAISPNSADTQGNLGVLLYFQGKFSDAIPHFRAALDQQPSLIKIQGLLGIAELRTLDFRGARKDLEASFPQIAEKKFKTQVGLELVGLDTKTGDLDEAARVIAELQKADPENAEVQYAAYRTYSELSEESMTALALAAPDSAQMHQLLAHEEIKEGNTNGAITQYRKAIAIDPHLPGIHFELADLLNTSQDANIKKQAEQEFRAALTANPLDEKAECKLGEIAAERRDTKQAYDFYSRAAELQPADPDAKLGLAKVLIEMNQADKAQVLLEQTIQIDPMNAVAHYRLATLYRKEGRLDDAKHETDLYKLYKEMREKLRVVYKELMRQPGEIDTGELDEK
jgi:Tfp pilus assembly protein PilF